MTANAPPLSIDYTTSITEMELVCDRTEPQGHHSSLLFNDCLEAHAAAVSKCVNHAVTILWRQSHCAICCKMLSLLGRLQPKRITAPPEVVLAENTLKVLSLAVTRLACPAPDSTTQRPVLQA